MTSTNNLRNKIKVLITITLFTISLSFIQGCTDDNSIIPPQVEVSYLTFTNASPDAPNVDLYVGGALAQANIPYLGTMNYKNFLVGNNVVTAYVAGTTSNPLIDTTIFLQQNTFYSVFAIDSLQSIYPLIINDDLTAPGPGNCRARFINLSPNAPAYDVQAVGKIQPWFVNDAFGVVDGYRPLTQGLYDININLALTSTTVLDVPNQSLTSLSIYTFITRGFVGGTGAQALGFTKITNFQN